MRRAFFLLLLLAAADGAAGPRCTRGRGCDRGSGGDDALFTFAPASGAGLPTVTELCTAAAGEMTGSYWCLKGDGSALAGGQSITNSGAPVAESLPTCPNGPDCAALNVVLTPTTSDFFRTASMASPAGDFSLCWLGRPKIDGAGGFIDMIGRDSGGTGRSFYLEYSNSAGGAIDFTTFKSAAGFTITNSGGGLRNGVRHLVCATYNFVADGTSVQRVYQDGAEVQNSTSAVGPIQANNQITGINSRDAAGFDACAGCIVEGAFYTEKTLSPATVAALASATLARTPRSEQGHALTLSRGSGKFCAKSDQSAGTWLLTNTPPCVRNGGVEVEGGSTDLILQSGNLGNVAWTAAGGVVAAPTVTANSADLQAPDGTRTATKIAYPAVSGASAFSVVFQQFVATAAAHSQALYLRTASGTATVYLPLSSGGTYKTATCSVTTTWTRCLNINQTLTAATWTFSIGVDLRDAGQSSKSAQTIYAWGAQVEADPNISSYIATAGTTVSRSIESGFTFTPTPPLPSATEGCTKLTYVPGHSGTPATTLMVLNFNAGGSFRAPYVPNAIAGLNAYDGTHIPSTATTFTPGSPITVRTTWSAAANLLRINSTVGGVAATTVFTSMGAAADQYQVLNLSGAGAFPAVLRDVMVGVNSTACGSTP